MAGARERLVAARAALDAGAPSAAVSLAYYGMLYAARAALSEEDRYAKTHGGTWDLFHRTFVAIGRFDSELAAEARRTEQLRGLADYGGWRGDPKQAAAVVEQTRRFVDAIADMLA